MDLKSGLPGVGAVQFSQKKKPKRVIIVGGGVGGSEAGTHIGIKAKEPIEVIQIEQDPSRKFGGYGFQSFPATEKTNLALYKMYLGDNPDEIIKWAADPKNRKDWPEELKYITLDPQKTWPRILVKKYVQWRRNQVSNPDVSYRDITGEATRVILKDANTVEVRLEGGRAVTGNQLIMASGSIAVKIPDYLKPVENHPHVVIDPLVIEGHERRASIPQNAKVLVLGTGLTGEEQVNVLLKSGHNHISLLSRGGKRHYAYPEEQSNKPLMIGETPEFFKAETPEEFDSGLQDFYAEHLAQGHNPEDILEAIRPHWDATRKAMGGCLKAAERLHAFKREFATQSIGTSYEVRENTLAAEAEGKLTLNHGYIKEIIERNGQFEVTYTDTKGGPVTNTEHYDYIINAIGRNIIRHPIWEQMLADGIAEKHAGIGVRVNEHGQLMDKNGHASSLISVVGMARSGDHALRRGYLGNRAFNVPQIRSHCYPTVDAMLERLSAMDAPEVAKRYTSR